VPDPPHPGRTRTARLVILPATIDIANASRVRDKLAAAAALPGITTVIADLRAAGSCDCEGAYSLVQAHRQAAVNHVDLRLVAPSAGVQRIFAILRLDGLVHLYPSVDAALAPAAVPLPVGAMTDRGSGRPDTRCRPTEPKAPARPSQAIPAGYHPRSSQIPRPAATTSATASAPPPSPGMPLPLPAAERATPGAHIVGALGTDAAATVTRHLEAWAGCRAESGDRCRRRSPQGRPAGADGSEAIPPLRPGEEAGEFT
jgi:anti-anti-sigma factor